ncbi:WD40-repeat-containing domain protein [Coprinopsis sp. MPI-PUGE-AT-0042]|nr:WD40-repeat-containing domain protein [Coprinopsis sp. MPI-PUGE-AT-0042]
MSTPLKSTPLYKCIATRTDLHRDSVNCLQFSPNGRFLASGGDDRQIVVVAYKDVSSHPLRLLVKERVVALCWTPDSKGVFVGMADGTLYFAHVLENEGIITLSPLNENLELPISDLRFSKAASMLAAASGGNVYLFHVRNARQNSYSRALRIEPPSGVSIESTEVQCVQFCLEGKLILVTYAGIGFRLFDLEGDRELCIIPPASYRLGKSALNERTGSIVCSNLYDGFDFYDLEAEARTRTLHARLIDNVCLPVAFIHNGRDVLLGTSTGTVRIINAQCFKEYVPLAHNGLHMIQALAYRSSSDRLRHYIATAPAELGEETYLKVWEWDETAADEATGTSSSPRCLEPLRLGQNQLAGSTRSGNIQEGRQDRGQEDREEMEGSTGVCGESKSTVCSYFSVVMRYLAMGILISFAPAAYEC